MKRVIVFISLLVLANTSMATVRGINIWQSESINKPVRLDAKMNPNTNEVNYQFFTMVNTGKKGTNLVKDIKSLTVNGEKFNFYTKASEFAGDRALYVWPINKKVTKNFEKILLSNDIITIGSVKFSTKGLKTALEDNGVY
ncbi:TPA: hypothetical protein ACX6R5_003276 [Photobacterium damselae]